MNSKYVLDSSAWLEYFDGSIYGAKISAIIEEGNIGTSLLAITEIADKFERENKSFEQFLRFIQSRATILPLTLEIVLHAAKLKKQIRAKNNKFGLVDSIHLATALQEKAVFVTSDRDFSGVENVLLLG